MIDVLFFRAQNARLQVHLIHFLEDLLKGVFFLIRIVMMDLLNIEGNVWNELLEKFIIVVVLFRILALDGV